MYELEVQGLKDFEARLAACPEKTARAASMSINRAAKKARTWGARMVREQVRLSPSYLNDEDKGIKVRRVARPDDLVAIVSGRRRPVMLHRFVTGWAKRSRGFRRGARVRIKPGGALAVMRRAFEMRLKSGNRGLVIRTDGEEPYAAYAPMPLYKGKSDLWLLYGPSTDQVFNTVREDIAPDVAEFVGKEFDRQFARLCGK